MAFFGLLAANVLIILVVIALLITLLFLIVGIILVVVGKKTDKKFAKITGIVFVVLSGLNFLIFSVVFGNFWYGQTHAKITLPNGEQASYASYDADKMGEYIKSRQNDKLLKLIEKKPQLLYAPAYGEYYIHLCLMFKNVDALKIGLDRGLEFYDYDFSFYLSCIGDRKRDTFEYEDVELYMNTAIDEEDIQMVKFLLEIGCPDNTVFENEAPNILYDAVFTVYTEEDEITDDCLEFIRVFLDYGYSKDEPSRYGADLYYTTEARIEEWEDFYVPLNPGGKVDEFWDLIK